ncbi:hypothetical protein OSB04_001018 [Centaurea solstitialis]|uniref:Uncharacterized protein n=1 Tax=Centaurea solstitialis TaxID=347529 RepID=A0AA38WL27_9ASTR|nr:hypothetical protein OSB04_001018 [Centaurea solstitialis]
MVKIRFQKVAEMLDISNLKIQIMIRTQSLPPGINYRVHLIFKFCSKRKSLAKRMYVNLKYKKENEHLHSYFASWREDEWMMVELCRFSTHKGDADFKVLLKSFSRCYSGSRAIYIEGIEFRAIDNASSKILFDHRLFMQVKHEEIEKLMEVQNVSEYMLLAKDVLYTTSKEKLSDLKQPLHPRDAEMVELLPQQVFHIKCKVEYQSLCVLPCVQAFGRLSGLHCPVKVRDILRWKNKRTRILFFRSPNLLDQHDADWVPEQGKMDSWRNNYIPMNVKLIAFEGTMSGLIAFRLEVRRVL